MSDAILTESAPAGVPDAPASPRPRWGFWSTSAWGLAVILVPGIVQLLAIFAVLRWREGDALSLASFDAAMRSSVIVITSLTYSNLPATLLLLWLATRLARVPFADYLALKPVGGRTIAFALACMLGYAAASYMVGFVLGHGFRVPWVEELYTTAHASGQLWLVLLAVLVAAPVSEELFFRAFLFRGWAASRLRAPGAIVLASAIWAGMHIQYSWGIMVEIFGLGLLFGYLRVRSGSTIPTIIAHSVYSMLATIQAAIFAG